MGGGKAVVKLLLWLYRSSALHFESDDRLDNASQPTQLAVWLVRLTLIYLLIV
jgi:hypothetical protein